MNDSPAIVFTDVNERQGAFHRRTVLMGGLVGAGLAALGIRLVHLQVLQGSKYKQLSTNNQYNLRLLPPLRGLIVDRNGLIIAGNRPSFRVLLIKNRIDDIDDTLDKLAFVLPQTAGNRRRILRDINQSRRFVPTAVATDLTWEDFSRVNLYAGLIPGVVPDMDQLRVYYYGGAFSHVVGYVSKINQGDLEKAIKNNPNPDPLLFHPSFRIGKSGVERALDAELRGTAGAKRIEVNATGNIVEEDDDDATPSVPGQEVMLTLDAEVQNRAMEVFGDESGSAVMMNVHTGEVICMYSGPSFDANLFVSGISSKAYKILSEYERLPLLDKAIGSTFAPGSTFKLNTALALLQAGVDPKIRVNCPGSYQFGNRRFYCWQKKGHGPVDMHGAIKHSCDVYFYHMCNIAGPDRIADTARKLGLGQIFKDFELDGQKAGTIPDTKYKREKFPNDKTWHPGETLSVAIGQGYVNVNCLQLATYTARIANGHKAVTPTLIKKIGDKDLIKDRDYKDIGIPPEHLELVRSGMYAVSNDGDGTAFRASQLDLGGIKMSGKTGTAQVHSYDNASTRKSDVWKKKDHGLFVCFAPSDNPKYALAVILEHGVAGAKFAAPRAREIMRLALIKDPEMQSRIMQPLNDQQRLAAAAAAGTIEDVPEVAPDPTDLSVPTGRTD
jgi:penicillin-binding protein 2